MERDQKWMVENYDGDKNIVIEVESNKHTVYVYMCDNCIIQVKGKCNTITIGIIHKKIFINE